MFLKITNIFKTCVLTDILQKYIYSTCIVAAAILYYLITQPQRREDVYGDYQYYRGFQSSGTLASNWSTNTIEGSKVQVY